MRIFIVDGTGRERQVEASEGASLMETLRDVEDGVAAICGGMCSCATCHVYVDAAWRERLPAPAAEERELLASLSTARPESRLSCQIPLAAPLDGLKVSIAPDE